MKSLLIYNPYSGRTKAIKKVSIAEETLKQMNIDFDVFYPQYEKNITVYLSELKEPYENLIVLGGDGTLNEVINGMMLMQQKPKLLFIPNGTLNDFSKSLKLTKNVKKALQLLKTDALKMDVCVANGKYFVYGMAFGKYTNVSYKQTKTKKVLGKVYYYLKGIKDIFSKEKFSIIHNNEKIDTYLVMALNTQRVGGFKIHSKDIYYLDDGQLDIFIFKKRKIFSSLSMFKLFLFGDQKRKSTIHLKTSKIDFEISENKEINLDGEKENLTTKIHLEVIPQAISIYSNSEKHFIKKNRA